MYKLLVVLLLVFASCKEGENKNDALSKDIQELLYLDIVSQWDVVKFDNKTQQSQIDSWNEFRILKSELAQKPQATLGALRQKSELLSQQTVNVLGTMPIGLNTNEAISRIKVLLSKIKMLETQVHQDYLNIDAIIKYNTEVIQDFDLLEKQLIRIIVRSQLKLEEEPILYE